MNFVNKKNEKILGKNQISLNIKAFSKVNITHDGLKDLILNCTGEINNFKPKYNVKEDVKRYQFRNFIITDEIRKIFIEIDKNNIPIVQFIKWLVQKDYIVKEAPKQENKKYEHVEHDFTKEKLITIDDLISEKAMNNCYLSLITQVKITNTLDEIIKETNLILEKIKKVILKGKKTFTIFGNYTITENKLNIRINNFKSFDINEILMMYRKILMMVDDELRFSIIKNFRELMYVKAFTMYQENKNNEHFKTMVLNDMIYISKIASYYTNIGKDNSVFKTIYPDFKNEININMRLINHCMNIAYYKGKNIVSYDKYNFSYISYQIIQKKGSEILNIPVPLPKSQELKRSNYQSGYVIPNRQKKDYFLNDEKINMQKIVDMKLKQDYKRTKGIVSRIIDNRVLNAYCDSETEYKLCKGNQVVSKEIFEKLYDEMVEIIRNKTSQEIERANSYKKYVTRDQTIESSIQKMLKYDLVLKTELVMVQCNLENESKEDNIVIFVREDKKDSYGKEVLKHTYERKLTYYYHKETVKEISIIEYMRLSKEEKENYSNIDNVNVTSRVVYTKNIMDSFFKHLNQWYLLNIDYTSNKQPLLTVWFHNLKFDILSTGILQDFEKYNLELNQFNNQVPRFFDFSIKDEVCLKSTTKKPKLFFIDSFNFSPTNLAKMGETIGIKKPKELVDFNLNTNLKVDRDCLIYATMDVVILKEFINDFKSHILDYACLKYGAAGTAQNVFLSAFYGETKYIDTNNNVSNDIDIQVDSIKKHTDFKNIEKFIDGNYDKKFLHEYIKNLDENIKDKINTEIKEHKKPLKKIDTRIHLHRNPYLEALEMGSYFGGRTEVFNYTGLVRYVKSVDINSSYPSSMLKYLPTQYQYTINNPTEKQIDNILKNDNLYGLFKTHIREDNNRIAPLYMDNKIINPYIKNLTTALHEPEFKLLYERNKNIEVRELHVYSATNLLFADYINKWSFEKSYNKQAFIKNDVLVSISKLLMNSTYGKFGEKMRVSECEKLDKDQLYFWAKLISIMKNELIKPEELEKITYNFDLKDDLSYVNKLDFSIRQYYKFDPSRDREDIQFNEYVLNVRKYVKNENIRLTFFGGYMSYNKKVDIPSKNSSFILVGAITSYSRSALYQGIDKIGFENTFYGDTDSLYYNSKITDMFNEIGLDDIVLDNPENYRKVIERINEIAIKEPDKIHLVKSLISELHFWEQEYKRPYDILIRGNKDNVKIFYIDFDDVFVIGKDGTKEDYLGYVYHKESREKLHISNYEKLSKDKQKEYTNYKYCIDESNIEKFKKSIKKKKYFYCKLSEKHKGVSLRALLLNQDLYLIEDWLSIATQRNMFGTLDGQYITYKLKSLYSSRTDYQKSETISSRKKSVDFIVVNQVNDEYKNPIGSKYVLDYEVKYKYIEQQLKPLTITFDNKDNNIRLSKVKTKEAV